MIKGRKMDLLNAMRASIPKLTFQDYLFFLLFYILLFGVLFKTTKGKHWNKKKRIYLFLLCSYLGFVYASTVIGRPVQSTMEYNLKVFWSYMDGISTRGNRMIAEICLNILLLFPVGLLLPSIIRPKKRAAMITIFIGFGITCSIELLQLFLKRGLFEFDDIIHNMLGVLIGVMVNSLIMKFHNKS